MFNLMGKCYHAPEPVFKIDGVEYFAADALGVRDFAGEIVLNLSGTSHIPSSTDLPKELLEHITIPYKEVMIPWQDGGVPYVKETFWSVLHDWLMENKYTSVCVHCEAGHGRTGTALSSILIANLGWTARKALEYVRTTHCRHMVETSDQTNYLVELDASLNKRNVEEEMPEPSINILVGEYYASKEKELIETEMPEYKQKDPE